jgi:hypothetical protein
MNSRRLGCLSPLGLIAGALTVVVVILGIVWGGGSWFSPGELNAQAGAPLGGVTSHAELSRRCSGCHVPFWSTETMADRCLGCHTDIQDQLQDAESLHGGLGTQVAVNACRNCHTEHGGADASLTQVGADFPHEVTGFSLLAHTQNVETGQPFACQDCHTTGVAVFDKQVCVDCHSRLDAAYLQQHMQAFGDGCLSCHDGVDRYAAFDHQETGFLLQGGHSLPGCGDCHAGMTTPEQLAETSAVCFSCHAQDDAHAGQFGTDCAACHTSQAWKPASFDHNATDFPLTGAHVGLACTSCHAQGTFQGLQTACVSCHAEPAYHQGLFGVDCVQCHVTSNWRPASFNWPHTFPLGHGGAQTCSNCHTTTLSTYTCYTCHDQAKMQKEHNKEGITDLSNCARCHPTGEEGDD